MLFFSSLAHAWIHLDTLTMEADTDTKINSILNA